jgi:hypothetical protein
MTLAALEMNDQSLLIQAEDGALHAEPGFARLTEDGVVSGEQARAVAWREPQHVYDQYWCQLNQSPLPIRHRFARHHADIAFAQLGSLWRSAGSPASLIVLAPGSFADAQLSLLLGMIEALPAKTLAVVDSALAACAEAGQDTLYVDLQMHDTVLTVCRPDGDSIRIEDQEIFPGLGMGQLQNVVARHVSDYLVESYRFDPLHSSEAEQAIYDQIPHWLTALRWETDVSTRLESPQGEYACILDRAAIRELIADRLGSVRAFLDKWRNCSLLLSHATSLLTGLVDEFAPADVMDRTAGTQHCLAHHADFPDPAGGLSRLRSLSRSAPPVPVPGANGEPLATHLLWGDQAFSLDRPVSVRLEDQGPRIGRDSDSDAVLTVVMRNRSLEALQAGDGVALPPSCRPGESITVGAYEMKLIRVGEP